ncbi:MAG: hypothetical protein AAGK05_14160, partial [Pseudomonadota bacterium]
RIVFAPTVIPCSLVLEIKIIGDAESAVAVKKEACAQTTGSKDHGSALEKSFCSYMRGHMK